MPDRIFLLSPAHLGGKRAELLLGGRGRFPLAHRLRRGEPVPLSETFTFLSGLYFRGKLAYARRFARVPANVAGIQVITSNRGLLPVDTPMTARELRALAETPIHAGEPVYRDPLRRDLAALYGAGGRGGQWDVVLLGSIATGKYVDVLLDVVGERLLFPTEFVGRGDMSRGALLLRAARSEVELGYAPVAGAVRRGPRAPKVGADDGDEGRTGKSANPRRGR
ncbi:MAG TPA: hypothetical protein VFN08_18970 [Gemmatimonadales bacterium]|jgi:hypothetical protein|nr:hypothetical protein [Gemmatimonadales bacterium]